MSVKEYKTVSEVLVMLADTLLSAAAVREEWDGARNLEGIGIPVSPAHAREMANMLIGAATLVAAMEGARLS